MRRRTGLFPPGRCGLCRIFPAGARTVAAGARRLPAPRRSPRGTGSGARRRADKNSGKVDEDETEAAEGFELPGADLSNEELSVRVLPRQDDEFTCSSCFLVHHRSQLATSKNGQPVCKECAA